MVAGILLEAAVEGLMEADWIAEAISIAGLCDMLSVMGAKEENVDMSMAKSKEY